MKRVLVIAAHPDDELLGVGGTIRRLTNKGIECRAIIMAEGITSRSNKRNEADKNELVELKKDANNAAKIIGFKSIDFCELPDNRMDSMELLDVIKIVSIYIEKYQPDTIFTHHYGDLNIDHRITCEAVLTACRPVGKYGVKRILSFEIQSSTEWNYAYKEPFKPNVYYDITDTFDAKVKGMNCYRSESANFPHPRSIESLEALAKWRGSIITIDVQSCNCALNNVGVIPEISV